LECRVPPEKLVDQHKRPQVMRGPRWAVPDAPEVTYHRAFADRWDFVAFAETEHPDLDPLTPPRRPERR
jgi:hypothetical protein